MAYDTNSGDRKKRLAPNVGMIPQCRGTVGASRQPLSA
jgi:hypothetical protein